MQKYSHIYTYVTIRPLATQKKKRKKENIDKAHSHVQDKYYDLGMYFGYLFFDKA